MSRLLIEIHVPSLGDIFDISIPRNAKIYELLPLVTKAVVQLSGGLFVPNDAALCNGSTGAIYTNNMSVDDMKLQNGSRLMLI